MQFGSLVRGNGKTYIELKGAVLARQRIRCRSVSADGEEQPSCIVDSRSAFGNPAVVIPSLKSKQVVTAEAIDGRGEVVESIERSVTPVAAAFESKRNGLAGRDGIELVRNVDLQPCVEEAWIHVERIIGNDHGEDCDFVRGRVQVLVGDPAQLDAALALRAIDLEGRSVPVGSVCVLDGGIPCDGQALFPSIRSVAFSITMPRQEDGFFLEASFPGSGLPGGFAYIGTELAKRLRWDAYGPCNPGGDGDRYHDWFVEHHRASPQELALQRMHRFTEAPLFSIIVPLYETPLPYFREMMESVLDQTYARFELILVNASPENGELADAVEGYARYDERIVVVPLAENGGITLNTNEGIKVATGDFLCFFDHDDVLEPDILFEYAKAIEEHPGCDLLYCDEDKLLDGRYVGGFFKPDYDPLLILASNYVCHLLAVRKWLVDAFAELPGKEFDGSQDHNLTLLVAERARRVFHVRKVLYHWRMHEASTAGNDAAKPWTLESGRLAVERHLDRIGVPAEVSDAPGFPNCYLVDYRLPHPRPSVSVLLACNDAGVLSQRLESIAKRAGYGNLEVVVAWQGGRDEAEAMLEANGFSDSRVVQWLAEEGAVSALDRAAHRSRGSYLVFLGQEIVLSPHGWVDKLLGPVMRPDVVACGPRVLYRDGIVRQAGILMAGGVPIRVGENVPRDSWSSYTISRFARTVTSLELSCMLVERSAFEQAGGLDGSLEPLSASLDFCFKLQQFCGSVAIEPQVEAYYHGECAVVSSDWSAIGVQAGIMFGRWPQRFERADGLYNENLAAGGPSFALDVPRDSLSEGLQLLTC